jgi:tight adherence protein C
VRFLGAVLGLGMGLGLALVAGQVADLIWRNPRRRVTPFLRDLPAFSNPTTESAPVGWASILKFVAPLLETITSGPASVLRRLRRAGEPVNIAEFRAQQVLWGLGGLLAGVCFVLIQSAITRGVGPLVWVVLLVACGLGVVAKDWALTLGARRREQRIISEFPATAELLALAVAAGEGPVAALDRVTRRTDGALSHELALVLGQIRTGTSVQVAFTELAGVTGLSVLSRFAQAVAVAIERGTPLADVLHAQAADVREAGRRDLIESAAKKEIFMMVPVVFLVLPITVVFALWPGVLGLNLVEP